MENRHIRRLGILLVCMFVALFVQLNYLQVVRADKLANDPRNSRKAVRDFSQPRGKIVSADGKVLALSEPSQDSYKRQRVYPADTAALFAHVVGYFSFTRGSDGVEQTYYDQLSGRTRWLRLNRLGDLLLNRSRAANVTLTLRTDLQRQAANALGDRKGSVAALDPRSGAVLALVSAPSYDPNPLAGHDPGKVEQAFNQLITDRENKPMLARSYRERYFPGSTFKVVTAATALSTGIATPDQPKYPVLTELPLPQATKPLKNFAEEACGGSLADALRVSCNTVFAQIGLDLGGDRLSAGARQFGFGQEPPIDLPSATTSFFPDASAFARDKPALAQSAIGQRDVSASPLQMALVAAAVANGGAIMKPHVMAEVRDDAGEVLERYVPTPWLRPLLPQHAGQLRDMMIEVVQAGTATVVALPDVQVAAKTGTAQLGTQPPSSHAWMIAFAPAEAPRVAVAAMVEGTPGASEVTGAQVAGPIVRAVLQAALRGEPS